MKKFHPFFSIGTIGVILTAFLHIFFTLSLSLEAAHSTFFIMYAVFFPFLILGVILSDKKHREELSDSQ